MTDERRIFLIGSFRGAERAQYSNIFTELFPASCILKYIFPFHLLNFLENFSDLVFAAGVKNNLLLDHPVWAEVKDAKDTMTAMLFRKCAVRTAVIVEKLREAGFQITNDCVEQFLLPPGIMQAEVVLEQNPTEAETELLDIFNWFWDENKEKFEASNVPALFSTSGGSGDLSGALDHFVNMASSDQKTFPGDEQDGQDEDEEEEGEEEEEEEEEDGGFCTSTPISSVKPPQKPQPKPRTVSVSNPPSPISRTVQLKGVDLHVQTFLAADKKRKRSASSSSSDEAAHHQAKKKTDERTFEAEETVPIPAPRTKKQSKSLKESSADQVKRDTYAEKARSEGGSGEGNFQMMDGTRVHRPNIRKWTIIFE